MDFSYISYLEITRDNQILFKSYGNLKYNLK